MVTYDPFQVVWQLWAVHGDGGMELGWEFIECQAAYQRTKK